MKISTDKISGADGEANESGDDVYETIEFSDSSHIYTEPFAKAESNYGALRKVNVKTTTTSSSSNHSKQMTKANAMNKRSANSTPQTKMGIKKSSRVRNLQKFPAMQDVSKEKNSTDEDNGEQVELRAKSKEQVTSNAKRTSSRQIGTLVSVGLTNCRDKLIAV